MSIAGGISFGGFTKDGTDFDAIVGQMVNKESRLVVRQEIWKEEWEVKRASILELDKRLVDLKNTVQRYDEYDELLSREGVSSDDDILTVANGSTATPGSYSVEVGEKIKERIGSRPIGVNSTIGDNYYTNEAGQAIDPANENKVIGATEPDDPAVIAAVAEALGEDDVDKITYNSDEKTYEKTKDDDTKEALATYDGNGTITKTDGEDLIAQKKDGVFVLPGEDGEDDEVIATEDPKKKVLKSIDHLTNEDGQAVDSDDKVIGATAPDDPAIMELVAKAIGLKDVNNLKYEEDSSGNGKYTVSDETQAVFEDGKVIHLIGDDGEVYDNSDDGEEIAKLNTDSSPVFVLSGDDVEEETIIATMDPNKQIRKPLTFTMDGKTLTIEYDHTGTLDTPAGSGIFDPSKLTDDDSTATPPTVATIVYHEGMDIEELNQVINQALDKAEAAWTAYELKPEGDKPPEPPDIKVELENASSRDGERYKRFIITGQEGGRANNIIVDDPTSLSMDSNYVNAVQKTQWSESGIEPSVADSSKYTGHTNKTILITATSDDGVMGVDDIEFTWADTQSQAGTFVIKASDWDHTNNRLKEPVEISQGIFMDFAGGANSNKVVKNNTFEIVAHAPVQQKASDSGMAQTDQWTHRGVANQTSYVSIGQGNFDYSYAGKDYSVTLTTDMTISALAKAINDDSKNPGVKAEVRNDGNGTSTSYKLVLTGHHEGSENGIRILDTTDVTGFSTGPDAWTHAMEASDSMYRINGDPADPDIWNKRPTNILGDAIDGLVLTLKAPGKVTVNVQNNITEMVERIQEIVASVNFTKEFIKEETKVGEGGKLVSKFNEETGMYTREREHGGEENEPGVMIGNYGFQMSQSNIDSHMVNPIFDLDDYVNARDPSPDLDDPAPIRQLPKYPPTPPNPLPADYVEPPSQNAEYQQYLKDSGLEFMKLSDIGIESDPDNKGLYTVNEGVLSDALRKNTDAVLKLFTFRPGDDENTFPVDRTMLDEEPRPYIGGFNVMLGYTMSDMTRTNDVIDPETGDVVWAAKGVTTILSEQYTNIMDGIDKKIKRETERLALKEKRLTAQFDRLETNLVLMEKHAENVQKQIQQMEQQFGG